MSIYDKIQSPLTNENIVKMLEIYAKANYNKSPVYNYIIKDETINSKDVPTYKQNFDKYIRNPAAETIYNSLIKDGPSMYDQHAREFAAILQNDHKVEHYEQYVQILNNFHSYKDFEKFYQENVKKYENLIKEYFMYDVDSIRKAAFNKLKAHTGYTDNIIESMIVLYEFRSNLGYWFANSETMGFHVNPQKLKRTNEKRPKTDIKLYINVSEDTYQFANLFQKKCEERGLYFYYKVANPYTAYEDNRKDKMCIYAQYKNLEEYIKIINEIKNEHPEFKYDTPPITCGTIDNFIGFGQDNNDSLYNRSSYNLIFSEILIDAIKNVLNNQDIYRIIPILKANPNHPIVDAIRKEIKRLSKEQGLDSEKICLKNTTKNYLKQGKTNVVAIKYNNGYYIPEDIAIKTNQNYTGRKKLIIRDKNNSTDTYYYAFEGYELTNIMKKYPEYSFVSIFIPKKDEISKMIDELNKHKNKDYGEKNK